MGMAAALQEGGLDVNDPTMTPDKVMEGMGNVFSNVMDQNKDNPEFKEMMKEMGSKIINKDMLYPPMLALKKAYPEYLEENADKLSVEDLEKYNKQLDLLEEVCKEFEKEQFDVQKLLTLVNDLQKQGNPPQELVAKLGSLPQFQQIPQID